MSHPWMPLYVGDYLADTGHLSTVEHGAYMLLIMHYWQHEGLPTEDLKLARIARLEQPEWLKCKDTLADLFGENWTHKRVDAELARASETVAKRSAAGRANAAARYSKPKAPASQPDAIGTQAVSQSELPRGRASQPPSPSEKVAAQPSARVAEKPREVITAPTARELAIPVALRRGERTADWFDQVEVEARAAAGLTEDPSPALLDVSPLVTLVDQGFDFARDILPKLRAAHAANKHGRTWAYYVPAITEGKAANSRIKQNHSAPTGPRQVWVRDDDPQWSSAAARWKAERGKAPPALPGSHGNTGQGWHFPETMLQATQ